MLLLLSIVLLLLAVLLLGVRIFFQKNGKFPNTHVGSSEYMKKKKIGCVSSQDREAQKNAKSLSTAEIMKQIAKKDTSTS